MSERSHARPWFNEGRLAKEVARRDDVQDLCDAESFDRTLSALIGCYSEGESEAFRIIAQERIHRAKAIAERAWALGMSAYQLEALFDA